MSKQKEKLSQSDVFGSINQWLNSYRNLCSFSGRKSVDANNLYLDVLKDLCNEHIPDIVVIHLLSLIEQMVEHLDNTDKVEQTVGSLINIYSTSTKDDRIRQKYLYTTTIVLTYHYEMTVGNISLGQLFDSVIQLLIKCSQKPKTIIGFAAVECLREIGISAPNLLESAYKAKQIPSNQTLILSSLISSGILRDEDIKNITNKLNGLQQLDLHHVLTQLFSAIHNKKYQELLSPLVFKPFLSQFTLCCEVYHFQFTLKLLISFGLELFSTYEEETLFKQLINLATHPSLLVGHRLLALDYTKSILITLKPSYIVPTSVEIDRYLDGPDTQEKKLAIINETSIANKDLLISLEPLKNLSLHRNLRATNSFYRIIYAILIKRTEMLSELEDILISVVFASAVPHIKRCIALLNCYPTLAKGTSHKLIENLKQVKQTFNNSLELTEFLYAFEWILKCKELNLTEHQIVCILSVIDNNCKRWVETSSGALSCCTAVLYYQTITDNVKTNLLKILDWLMNERKNDISLTSLAQIYILALNTLEDDENIKKVFNDDNDSINDLDIVKDISNQDIHFAIKRVNSELKEKIKNESNKPFYLDLYFQISLKDNNNDQIFAIVLFFDSLDGNIKQETEIAILNEIPVTIELCIKSRIDGPFSLNISAQYNDINGTVFKCDSIVQENITLSDICLPIDIKLEQFNDLCESLLKHSDSMQTVICLEEYQHIDEFLSRFNWLRNVIINEETNQFVCAISDDRLILGSIQIVNGFVNLYLITNNYELLPKFYFELKGSLSNKNSLFLQ